MTTIPSITALPTPAPSTADPDNFNTRADALLAALPTMVTEENLAIAAMNTVATEVAANATTADTAADAAVGVTTLVRNASDSLAISSGAKNLTGLNSPSAATFANGDEVYLIRRGDRTERMWGEVSSANMAAGTMTVTVASGNLYGSGTHTDWVVIHSSFVDVEFRPPQTLTSGATVTPDFAFENHTLTAAHNFALATPTNLKSGKSGIITIKQDATGSRTWTPSSAWKFPGGAPALSTAANAADLLAYYVEDDSTPIIRAVLSKAFS